MHEGGIRNRPRGGRALRMYNLSNYNYCFFQNLSKGRNALAHKGATTSNAFLDAGQRKRTSTMPCNSYPQENMVPTTVDEISLTINKRHLFKYIYLFIQKII